jgi:RecA-family ATPase
VLGRLPALQNRHRVAGNALFFTAIIKVNGHAISKNFKIPREEIENNFLVTNGFETPIKVANGGRDVKIDGGLRKEIIEVIAELKIDAVIFDPLVAMHRVHEDFNSALDPVIRDAFGKIAHDTNCAIDLCHHTRKKPAGHDGEYTVADSRGGQSLVDALRGARVLNTMSKTEATNFDLREDDRFDYMRLSRGKANMVRRGTIGWYRFHNRHRRHRQIHARTKSRRLAWQSAATYLEMKNSRSR